MSNPNQSSLVGPDGKPLSKIENEVWMGVPDDVFIVTDAMARCKYKGLPTITEIERASGFLRDKLVSGEMPVVAVDWRRFFLSMGAMTIDIIGKAKFNRAEFAAMLIGKHKRYGTRSLMGWRQLGILSRIDQKIARARNMLESPELAADDQGESMKDTMVDIVGYCVLGIYMIERIKIDTDRTNTSARLKSLG